MVKSTETGKAWKDGIYVEKLILNCSVGESGDKLTRGARVLQQLTKQKPIFSKARYTVRQFSIRRNEKISCYELATLRKCFQNEISYELSRFRSCSHVTVRGQKAEEILDRGLKVKESGLFSTFLDFYNLFPSSPVQPDGTSAKFGT